MTPRPVTVSIAALVLAACGSGSTGPASTPDTEASQKRVPPHQDLIQKAYDPAYSVPEGFFVDERADTPRSFTVYHVKDESISYELCTDDYLEAMQWEQVDNGRRAVNGAFVGSRENELYYEFIRELTYSNDVSNAQGLSSPGFARVFKCSHVNRNGVDRNLRSGFGGQLNSRPLSAGTVRDFTEYMWQFTFFAASSRKVLESITVENDDSFEHTLRLALVYQQGSGRCDRVDVVDMANTSY